LRYYALDLLRFLSSLAVVIYHYTARADSLSWPSLAVVTQFGYLGVPIFYIVSGFVIALSAEGRTPVAFGISRFVRLYPTYWVSLGLTILAVLATGQGSFEATQVAANLTMLNDYLEIPDIDGVYWTLQVELKFYACVFLLLLTGVFHRYRIWVTVWLALTTWHVLIGPVPVMGWFINPGYSPFFISGVAFHLIGRDGFRSYNSSILGVAFVLSMIMTYRHAPPFVLFDDAWIPIVSCVTVALAFGFFALLTTGRLNRMQGRWLLTLGGLTYPLYLLHSRAGKALIDTFKPQVPEWLLVIGVTALMLAVSYAIHRLVDVWFCTRLRRRMTAAAARWKLV